jgi:Major capsid protein N-terminus
LQLVVIETLEKSVSRSNEVLRSIECNAITVAASQATATISRYGDLVSRITLEITLPPLRAPVIPNTSAGASAGAVYAETGAYYVNAIGFNL